MRGIEGNVRVDDGDVLRREELSRSLDSMNFEGNHSNLLHAIS
jgi:hypothetical protein